MLIWPERYFKLKEVCNKRSKACQRYDSDVLEAFPTIDSQLKCLSVDVENDHTQSGKSRFACPTLYLFGIQNKPLYNLLWVFFSPQCENCRKPLCLGVLSLCLCVFEHE